jgi:dTDP-4-amino-4,6-dideoxygalactose transaminase
MDRRREERARLVERYALQLADLTDIELPAQVGEPACAGFSVFVPGTRRDEVPPGMAQPGVVCAVHYRATHQPPWFREPLAPRRGEATAAARCGERISSLPPWAGLSTDEQDYVVRGLRESVST